MTDETPPLPLRRYEALHPAWGLYSLAIIVLMVFFQVMQWPLFPKFLDIYYHLGVMRGFEQAGGYTTKAFWEYAPVGRPHLYPPLLHALMLGLHKMGMPPMDVARFVDAAMYPALLFVFWHATRRIFSSRIAFFSTLIFSSSSALYYQASILAPFTLAFMAGLLALEKLEHRKTFSAGLWLSLSFYAHTWMAFCMLFSFLVYGVLNLRRLRRALWGTGIAMFTASPLLLFQWRHASYFSFLKVSENSLWSFDVFIYGMAFFGLLIVLKKRYYLFAAPALLLGTLPLAFTHAPRYFSGFGMTGLVWMAALSVDMLYRHFRASAKNSIIFLLSCFLIFHCFGPVLRWDRHSGAVRLSAFDRTLTRFLLPEKDRPFEAKGFTVYFQKDYADLEKIILQKTQKDDILWSDFPHGAALLGALTGRATSSATLPEVAPFRRFDPMRSARLLIWFKNADGKLPEGMAEAVKRYRLSAAGETSLAYLYERKTGYPKRKGVRAFLPTPYLLGALGTLMILAFYVGGKRIGKSAF